MTGLNPPPETLTCRRAGAADVEALQQLLELYQYEPSDLWPQDLDEQGRHAGCALVASAVVTRREGWWQGPVQQFDAGGAPS